MLTHCKLCNRHADAGDLDNLGICSECEPARARIASLEVAVASERTEHDAALAELTRSHTVVELEAQAEIERLEAEIEVERGRAEKATARCVELFDQFSAAVARAEKARWWKCPVCTEETETADVLAELRCPCCGHTSAPVLAAARSDAVREFAEWLHAQYTVNQSVWVEHNGIPCICSVLDAAARYLASEHIPDAGKKEPSDG